MLTGKPDILDRIAQILIALVGLFCAAFGTFMIVTPLDWYTSIPTLITTGPPNQHFIRDIGFAYVASGIMLLYAARNIHMRWMAAVAGNLWLTLHGLLHIYEVSVGICSVGVFWADAPGTLGPPLLVFIALGIIMARQRITPAGISKSIFMRLAGDMIEESEKQYLEEIAAAPGHAFEKFTHFMPATKHRHDAPAELFHAASIGATLAEDCGPCALTGAEWAMVDNVSRDTINRWFRGEDVPEDEKLALDFGLAIAKQSDDALELGEKIEAKYGRTIRLELAMTAATVRAYPGMKRGLGLTKACSLTPLQV